VVVAGLAVIAQVLLLRLLLALRTRLRLALVVLAEQTREPMLKVMD
jgi:hypothetical protein